jgi:hypothetical protein
MNSIHEKAADVIISITTHGSGFLCNLLVLTG